MIDTAALRIRRGEPIQLCQPNRATTPQKSLLKVKDTPVCKNQMSLSSASADDDNTREFRKTGGV
jgi:hypothetical protein